MFVEDVFFSCVYSNHDMGKKSKNPVSIPKQVKVVTPQPMVLHKSQRLSENKANYYLRTIEIYFTRIDTNPLAQTAKFRLLDLVTRHNTYSSQMERDGLYRMMKHMESATLARERHWYKVPFLQYDEMRFFDRKNPDGSISYRNMPLKKKNKAAQRRRVEREMEEWKNGLSQKTGQESHNMVFLDRNDRNDRRLLSLLA